MNTNTLKDILKFIQFVCVVIIPLAAIQFYFPTLSFLGFIAPVNSAFQGLFSGFINLNINGTDWTLVAITVPWIVFIIIIDAMLHMIDGFAKKAESTYITYKMQRSNAIIAQHEQDQINALQKKQAVYLVIQMVFSKFTISILSDEEVIAKKAEKKAELLKDLSSYHGKIIDDEEFDDDDTFALMFFSQDDAINFVTKLKALITYMDSDLQSYGFSLAFKAILDSQNPEAIKFYVLQFLERALRTNELNEISTTNDFARRYKEFGKMKQIDFVSKGNYSINKERVELNRLVY